MEQETTTIRCMVNRAGKARALADALKAQIDNRESHTVEISERMARSIRDSLEEYRELILEMRIEF